jgi:phage tail-like protein
LKQAKSAWKSPARDTITIKLMDQDGDPTMTWTLANAWPTRITSTDLKSDGNDVALEALDIAYDGLTIANG